jgi:RimJ/RimL family protein N-acetyltransferase
MSLKNRESVLIREARGSDASRILEFLNTISSESDFLTFGQGEFVMSVEQEEDFLNNIAKQNNALFIVAESKSEIIGTASFSGGSRARISHTGELSVSILKEYWGNGIGTELVKHMIDWCKQSGVIRKINLIVRNDNLSAIHIYKKLGFTEEGAITRELQIDGRFYDALFMGYKID